MWFSPPKRCNLFSLSSGALHPVYAAAASCSFSLQAKCGHTDKRQAKHGRDSALEGQGQIVAMGIAFDSQQRMR
jgi:hypothetical protein